MRLPDKGVAVFQMHQPMPASGNCRLHVDQIPVMENNLKSSKENAQNDSFPVGMRVLAVDDDPTCLRMLEGLLRACKYQVTVTNQANKALSLLRENKDKFDLVISDVHMPDMDGFKLLELVGLEMDLPVIMVSANGEIGNVMKGIKHGACDYLLKPIRLEELKNIWQHVIRKKGVDPKEPCIVGHGDQTDKINNANETSDQSSKLTRKHRDQSREEEDEVDDHFNEDLSAQKRPRVVWSAELHQQFLDAVNHLGIEKAVPKRILDLMNVPGLTRENVASHLQKYRLYLRKYSAEASQQCNMSTSVGGGDSPFLFLDSRDGISGQSPNGAHVSFDLRGPVNCFDGFGINGNTSGMIQFSNFQNSGTLSHYAGNQQNGLLQGLPTYIKIEEPHNNKPSSGFSGITSNNLTVKNIHQQPLEFKGPSYQSPVCTSPIPNQFDRYGGTGSHLSFYDAGSAPWQRGVSIIGYTNQQPIGVSLNSSDSAATDANSIAARKFETGRDQVLISCNPFEETKYGCSDISSEKSLATFPNVNAKQDLDSAPKQSLHGHKRDQGSNHNFTLPAGQHQGQNLGVCDGRINLDLRGKVNVGVLLSVQSCNDEQFKAGSPLDPLKLPSIFNPDSCSSADGLLNAMIKQFHK